MTVITGNIRDIGLQPLSGTLIATSVEFRSEGSILIAPESRSWPVTLGDVVVDLLPGPARITVAVGSHVRESWDVVVPDTDVELATLIEDSIEWAPPVVSIVGEHRRAAEAAAQRAEDAADDVDAAIAGAADQVVQAVEGDRILAEAARTGAETARDDAAGSAGSAEADRNEVRWIRDNDVFPARDAAAGKASADASSAGAANSSAGTATAQAGVASTAAGTATSRAGEAAGSASAAAGSAAAAAISADDAELWATSFGLTATSTTGAPGSSASVTVTGSGPEYGLSLTVPRGDKGDTGAKGATGDTGAKGDKGDTGTKGDTGAKGDKGDRGDDGEVSQAALDAAVASLVDNAPEALNTLSELATSLGNDPNFATTVSTEIGLRAKTADVNTALAGKADAGAETTATWAGVSGKPSTFPPAGHVHDAANINAGTLSIARIPTSATSNSQAVPLANDPRLSDARTPTAHSHTAAEVGAKPASYVPAWSEVTSKPATFPPTTGSTAATAKPGNYVPAWSEVTGKPTTFTPAAHSHPVTDLTMTGTASSTTFARGDGSWATPANTTYAVPSQAEAEAGTATTGRAFSAQRVRQAADAAISARIQLVSDFPASPVTGVLYLKAE